MIPLPHDSSDDPAFIEIARNAIAGDAARYVARFVHVVKLDAWFGDRWFGFSGKALGALGVHWPRLTVPPFHPHRVVGESRFRTGDPPEVVPVDAPLHAERPSASNLRNFVDRLGDAITIGWYSGDSASSGRGSQMVYSSTPRGAAGWYAGLQRRDAWRVVKLVGIGQREWDAPEARRATWPPRAPDFA